jgi:hypothetical protein
MASAVVSAPTVFGDQQVRFARVTLDTSYATGGEPISPALFGLTSITALVITSANVASRRPVWVPATQRIRVFVEDGTSGIEAEAANASNQSTVVFEAMVIGK